MTCILAVYKEFSCISRRIITKASRFLGGICNINVNDILLRHIKLRNALTKYLLVSWTMRRRTPYANDPIHVYSDLLLQLSYDATIFPDRSSLSLRCFVH
jgi:hypothetical protein